MTMYVCLFLKNLVDARTKQFEHNADWIPVLVPLQYRHNMKQHRYASIQCDMTHYAAEAQSRANTKETRFFTCKAPPNLITHIRRCALCSILDFPGLLPDSCFLLPASDFLKTFSWFILKLYMYIVHACTPHTFRGLEEPKQKRNEDKNANEMKTP